MQATNMEIIWDQQAAHYNGQSKILAPLFNGLYFLLDPIFLDLPDDAKILCVGAGTGEELIHLAQKHPQWTFTAVDISGEMLKICQARTKELGVEDRCVFHKGTVDTLATDQKYDAATSILVSQFILDPQARLGFFKDITQHLKPKGILVSADLACDVKSSEYQKLLRNWSQTLSAKRFSSETFESMRTAYESFVSILPSSDVASIIESAGFESPVQFFQMGLICAWSSLLN